MKASWIGSGMGAAALVACSGSGVEPVAPVVTAAPIASAAVTATPSASASVAPSAAASARAPTPFHRRVEAEPEVHPVNGAVFLYGFNSDTVTPILAPLVNGRIVRDDVWSRGAFGPYSALRGMAGTYPGDLWIAWIGTNGRVGWGEVFKHGPRGWEQTQALEYGALYTGVSDWVNGSVLALIHASWMQQKGSTTRFTVLSGRGGALPVITPGKGDCRTRVDPEGFRALPSGHVFVAGGICGEGAGAPALEWWGPGEVTGHVEVLPVAAKIKSEAEPMFAVRSERDVFVAFGGAEGAPVLAHFDGARWAPVDPPSPTAVVRSVAVTPDGALWVIAGNDVWTRPAGGAWAAVPLPPPGAAEAKGKRAPSTLVAAGDEVWLGLGGALYSTRPAPDAPEKLDWPGNTQFAGKSFALPKAATRECESVFALFYQFTKVTPDDYDFPLTRKGLKGQTAFSGARFVVTKDRGQRYFGAFAPSYDVGKAMVARVAKEVQGSQPQLLCAKPEVVREIKLDLATGEVVR